MKKKFKLLAVAPLAVGLGFILAACGNNNPATSSNVNPSTSVTPSSSSTPAPSSNTTPTPSSTSVAPSVDYDAILRNLNLDQDGKTVNADFNLFASLKDADDKSYPLTWTSSNENVVKVVTKDGAVTAGVVFPTEATTVTLTATIAEGKSKSFKVKVLPVDVYSFLNMKFDLASGIQSDGEVPFETTTKLVHKSVALAQDQEYVAEVAFSCEDPHIVVDNVNHKFVITGTDEKTPVKVRATFTFNGETTHKDYTVTIWHERTPLELLHYFYDSVGDAPLDLYGYVVTKAGYNPSYGNGYLNIMDRTKQGGYYVYRAVIEKADWDKLEVGSRVHISGASSTKYGELIETNGSTPCEICNDDTLIAPLSADELAALKAGTPIDDLVVFEQIKYQTGNMVSLTSWKVKSIGTGTTAGGALLTLEKDNLPEVTINVEMNKYTVDLNTEKSDAIAGKVNELGIKVGDYVNVKGSLYNYNGYLICPLGADWIEKTTNDNGASTAIARKLYEAVTAVTQKLPLAVTEAFTLNLSELSNDVVTANVELEGEPVSAKIENGVLTITPGDEVEAVAFTITFTAKSDLYGDLSIAAPYGTVVKALSDEEKAAVDALNVFPASFFEVKTVVDLPATGTLYGTQFSDWKVTEGAAIATIADGKLTIDPTLIAITVKVTCNVQNGTYSGEREFVFTDVVYDPSTVAEFIAANDTESFFNLDVIVLAYNPSNGNAVFADVSGGIFAYNCGIKDATKLAVGDNLVIKAKLSENNGTPQLSNMSIIENRGQDALAYAALTAAPEVLTLTTIQNSLMTEGATNNTVNAQYAGGYFVITGFMGLNGTYANLYQELGADNAGVVGNGFVQTYAPNSMNLASYAGKEVKVYCFHRGANVGAKNLQVQVISIEVIGDVPTPSPEPVTPSPEPADPTANSAAFVLGTEASAATVNGKEAVKVGTGKKVGNMSITVAAGTTTLSFYAAAWNGKTAVLTVTGENVTVSDASITLENNTGIAGSTQSFTLAGEEAPYLVTLTLSNATDGAKVTLATTDTSNGRFVVWGATAA